MHFALWNNCTNAAVTKAILLGASAAITIQLNRDCQAFNELGAGSTVGFYPAKSQITKADIAFEICDDIPEAPGAIAYHSRDEHGRPYCKLSFNACIQEAGGDLAGAIDQLTIALSHECLEAECNPYTREWSDDDAGGQVACEVGDPVQDQWYRIHVVAPTDEPGGTSFDVAVSDFITWRWFEPSGPGPYNYLHDTAPVKPLQRTSGGYVIRKDRHGNVTQDFGEEMSEALKTSKQLHGRLARWSPAARLDTVPPATDPNAS